MHDFHKEKLVTYLWCEQEQYCKNIPKNMIIAFTFETKVPSISQADIEQMKQFLKNHKIPRDGHMFE